MPTEEQRLKYNEAARKDRAKRAAAGLCITSGCPLAPKLGHRVCQTHLEAMLTYARERREKLIAAGKCIDCLIQRDPEVPWRTQTRCDPCADKGNKYQNRRMAEKGGGPKPCPCGQPGHTARFHARSGYCGGSHGTCPNKRSAGEVRCAEHTEEHRQKVLAYRATLNTKYGSSLCIRCHKRPPAAHSRSRCQECLDYATKHQKLRDQEHKTAERLLKEFTHPHRRQTLTILIDPADYARLASFKLTQRYYRHWNTTVTVAPMETVD